MIHLDPDERKLLAAYLKQEAATEAGLAEQTEKLMGASPIVERQRARALAYGIVAQHMESWKEYT